MKTSIRAALAFILVGLATLAQAADQTAFEDFKGQPRSIESYAGHGKWLVVMIWAHDCSVCNREAAGYAEFHQAHKDKDATMLGLSIDGQAHKADAEAFIRRHQLPFPNLLGEPQISALFYTMQTGNRFAGTPSILIYNRDGRLVAADVGAVPPEVIADFIAKQDSAAGG